MPRLVEAELDAHRLDVGLGDDGAGRRLLGGVDLGVVAGRGLDDEERDERDEQQRQRHVAEPVEQEARSSPTVVPADRPGADRAAAQRAAATGACMPLYHWSGR